MGSPARPWSGGGCSLAPSGNGPGAPYSAFQPEAAQSATNSNHAPDIDLIEGDESGIEIPRKGARG
jgi:hypothetical protein